jgi:Cu/Ag efflux pump CusA
MHDQKTQDALAQLDWTGQIKPYTFDYLHVNDSNFAGGKSNLYVQQKVVLDINIGNDGKVTDGLKRISVVTRLDNESKNSFSGMRDTTFPQIGDSISSVATVGFSEGRTTISHEGGKRTVVVSANYEGGDIVGTVEKVKQELEKSKKPENITISFEGTYQSQKENSTRLAILFSVVILVICYLLYQAFNSWILAMLIITNIPVAFFANKEFRYWQSLNRRDNNTGSLIPLTCCPLWSKQK